MKDIETTEDIESFIAAFYQRLLNDDSISYIFTDVAKIDLPSHLPHLVDFWKQIILDEGSYSKNVLKIHTDLNQLSPLTPAHFETWLRHFNDTLDQMFTGANVETMKTRALSIANVMQIKLYNHPK